MEPRKPISELREQIDRELNKRLQRVIAQPTLPKDFAKKFRDRVDEILAAEGYRLTGMDVEFDGGVVHCSFQAAERGGVGDDDWLFAQRLEEIFTRGD